MTYAQLYDRVWSWPPYHTESPEARALTRIIELASSLQSDDGKPVSVLSPGCGEGKTVRELVGRGFQAMGIDASAIALTVALREARDQFAVADCTKLRKKSFGDGGLPAVMITLEGMR